MVEIVISNWEELVSLTDGLDAIGVMYDVTPNKQGFYEYWLVSVYYIDFRVV